MRVVMSLAAVSAALALLAFASPATAVFEVVKDGIPKPLTSTPGSAARGKALLVQKQQANCLTCHRTKELQGGNIAPMLDGIALTKTEAQLRLAVVDFSRVKPGKSMPVFHNVRGEEPPRLSAQEVEDVVAFLVTLRKSPLTGIVEE
jgi:sulfur-oxidizing protein SoxX